MQCPFRYRWREKFSFGVAWQVVEMSMENDAIREAEFNAKYPTCWAKFMHWLRT